MLPKNNWIASVENRKPFQEKISSFPLCSERYRKSEILRGKSNSVFVSLCAGKLILNECRGFNFSECFAHLAHTKPYFISQLLYLYRYIST